MGIPVALHQVVGEADVRNDDGAAFKFGETRNDGREHTHDNRRFKSTTVCRDRIDPRLSDGADSKKEIWQFF